MKLKNLLRIMKLTAIILLSACLTASAKGYTQSVTLSEKNAPLQKVFKEIKKQTGYNFLYTLEQLNQAGPVDVQLRNASLEEAVAECLKGKKLTYTIVEKTIVIKRKEQASVIIQSEVKDPPPPIDVRGRILNEEGQPIAASILVKGTQQGTATNAEGYFELKGVDENATLIISGIGVVTFEERVRGRSDLAVLNAKTKISPIDEVQVIGYGQQTRRFATGSVSTITSREIERQPVMNVLQAVQGQIPGLTVDVTSGAPGAQIRFQLRGQNTVMPRDNGVRPFDQPLIIIDGVPYAPQNNSIYDYSKLGGSGAVFSAAGEYGVSPLNSLNPADIESISFLKDADATSIYGSLGLNGVMLITTKKGKPGKTKFTINVYTAPEKVTKRIEMLNTKQYLELRREGLRNDGITSPDMFNHPDLIVFDSTKNTDWAKEFYGRTANNTTVNTSLSGGIPGTTYLLSAGYTKSTYNFPGDFKNERATLHTTFSHSPASSKLSVDFGTDFSYNTDNTSAGAFAGLGSALPPNMPDLLNPDGSLVWEYKGYSIPPTFQLNSFLRQTVLVRNLNLNSNLRLAYEVLPGLRISNNVGYSYFDSDANRQSPSTSNPPTWGIRGSASFTNSRYQTLNIEPQAEYQKNISKGRLSLLLGGTYRRNLNTTKNINASDYPNDALLGSPNGAGSFFLNTTEVPYNYAAVFGRANYVHNNKYIINITGRRDGSSNFGPGRRFGNFGSAGLGWIVSEESFFKKGLHFINYAKLSGNYGTVGSDGIEPYLYQDYWRGNTFVPPFQGAVPYTPNNLRNPDYSWGTKRMWNAALDFGFFDNRLILNATWYRHRTSNQLSITPLPIQTGFSGVLQNFDATVENSGWEFSFSSENIKRRKNFSWSSGFNISFNRNKLIAFNNLEISPFRHFYRIGRSTNALPLYDYKGINDTTGIFEFYKADGKTPTYAPASSGGIGVTHDQTALVDLQPKFTGGLTNSFSYKGFELSFLFQFVKQTAANHLYGIYRPYLSTFSSLYNLPVAALNRWQKIGDKAELQKLTSQFSNASFGIFYFMFSDGAYGDASYIRLKNLSFSYTLPASYLHKLGIENSKVFINAQNLLTITGYKIGDPEMPGDLYSIPPQRTIAVGLSLTF